MAVQIKKVSKRIVIFLIIVAVILVVFFFPKPTTSSHSTDYLGPVITTESLPEAKLNQPYSVVVEGSDPSTTSAKLFLHSNTLPYQFGFGPCTQPTPNSISCPLRGTPQTVSNFRVELTLINKDTKIAVTKNIFVGVGTATSAAMPTPEPPPNNPPHLDFGSMPTGFMFRNYTVQFVLYDSDAQDRLGLSFEKLPLGLTLSSCKQTHGAGNDTNLRCLLTGKPQFPGLYYPQLTITDNTGHQASYSYPLVILP